MLKYTKKRLLELASYLELNYKPYKYKKKQLLIDFIKENSDESQIEEFEKTFPVPIKKRRGKKNANIISRIYDLPELTEEEQKTLIQNRKVKLYSGTTPFKLKPTDKDNIIQLEKHQKDFLNAFCFSGIRGAIAFHGVGTGKTNVCVSCTNIYLELFPNNKVVFISPPVLLPNFISTLAAYGIDPRDKRITYHSYDSFYKSNITLENTLLIVDEAHNYRTEGAKESDEYQSAAGSKKSSDLTFRAQKSHKALLLTGTAFVNKLYDIENLLAMANGQEPKDPKTFYDIIEDPKIRYDYMKYRISMYFMDIDYKTNKKQPHNPNFPTLEEIFVPIVSSSERILARASRSNPVYSMSRQVSLNDEKIKFCVDVINNNPNKKYVIYTAFLQGVDKLITSMSKIKFGIISGEINSTEKEKAINDYNDNKIQLLIITKAGSEGVNLKETRGIFIIDGVWNEAAYTQIVARAVRYQSHQNLPAKDRTVVLYKLFVCTPKEKEIIDLINSGAKFDFPEYIKKIAELRKRERELAKVKGKEFSTRSKVDESLILKNLDKIDDFDRDEYLKLKGKAKQEYHLTHGNFMKEREKYLTDELKGISEGIPSTDFYMFALQKSKEKIITDFIKQIALIPDAEQAYFDMDLGKKTNDFIRNAVEKGKDDEFIAGALIQLLKPFINDAINVLKPMDTKELNEIISKGKEKASLQLQKSINRVLQEFFTPTHIVKQLIEMSGILKDPRDEMLYVLEPSAGDGAIVKQLVELMKIEKKTLQIDMVEILERNRKELADAVKEIPGYLNLTEEGDFLKYQPNKQYDYIIMNPPFHLKNIDKYDYDFVLRAATMLKPGGVLIAITGQSYLKNDKVISLYKQAGADIKLDTIRWEEKQEGKKLKNEAMNIAKLPVAFIKIVRPKNISMGRRR